MKCGEKGSTSICISQMGNQDTAQLKDFPKVTQKDYGYVYTAIAGVISAKVGIPAPAVTYTAWLKIAVETQQHRLGTSLYSHSLPAILATLHRLYANAV